VECEYQAPANASSFRSTRTAVVQVAMAAPTGAVTSVDAIGTAAITLTGGGSVRIRFATDSLPLVFPSQTAAVRVNDARDVRANRLPEDSHVQITAASSVTLSPSNYWYSSAGGSIVDGFETADFRFRAFPIQFGEVTAAYSQARSRRIPARSRRRWSRSSPAPATSRSSTPTR
jgi:hypothetical protein